MQFGERILKKMRNFSKKNCDFKQNKKFMLLSREKFCKSEFKLDFIIRDFSHEESESRFSFCETFRVFGNSPHGWCGGGENDIKALCQCLVDGWQDADARRFSTSYIARACQIVSLNDKSAFFDLCQSIYRSSQANSPRIIEIESDKFYLYTKQIQAEEEELAVGLSMQIQDWVDIVVSSTSDKVRAGNKYPIRRNKKTSNIIII